MFDTVCTFPLKAELFAQAVHPTASLVTVGLTSGHVAALRLPPVEGDGDANDTDDADDDDTSGAALNSGRRGSDGTGFIDTAWQTKRHKGSCRCLTYSLDGTHLFSAGTDGLVKAANSETGVVTGKLAIPQHPSSTSSPRKDPLDPPTVIHALSPQTLLLSTDSGALHLYDLRDPSTSLSISTKDPSLPFFPSPRPSQTYHPHTDFISSLTPLPASETSTSGYSKQWLTTGGTTLAVTDLRRGVLAKSADQEELLLSSTYVTGLSARRASTSTGEKAVIGGGDGVLTLWEKGQWDDQDERIIVSREGETLDCLVRIPDGIGGFGKRVAVGVGDGRVRFVKLGQNKIVGEARHDEVEGVVALGFDQGGRMISGGGMVVKVWQEHIEGEDEEDEEDGEDGEETVGGVGKRAAGSEDDSDEESGDESSDEEAPRQRRKKRRKGKGPVGGNAKKFDFAGLD